MMMMPRPGASNIFGTPQAGATPSMFGAPTQPGGIFSRLGTGLTNNSNRLLLAGLGLLGGRNPSEQWQGAAQGFIGGSQMDTADREQKRLVVERKKTQDALDALVSDQSATGPMADIPPVVRNLMARDPGFATTVLAQRLKPAKGASNYGVAPMWGYDEKGNPVAFQLNSAGGIEKVETPEGITLSPPGMKAVDTGTGTDIINRAGAVESSIPKDVRGAAAEAEVGSAQGKIAATIPQVQRTTETIKNLITSIKNDPARTAATGWQSNFPTAKGSAVYGFERKHDQLRSNAFLQGFETLRGAGAITETEGTLATNAITRIDLGLSDEDYETAIDELNVIVGHAEDWAKARAGLAASPVDDAAAAAAQALKAKYNME